MTFEKAKLLHGLEASLNLMPYTNEHNAIFLFNVGVAGMEVMQHHGLLDPGETETLHRRLFAALQEAHPSLAARFIAGENLYSPVMEQMLAEGLSGDELTDRTRDVMREFADALRKPH